MAKKYKTLLSLLLAVLIIVSFVMVSGIADINKIVREREEKKEIGKEITYTDFFRSDTSCPERLMKTDIENIFYTMTPDGKTAFYRVGSGKIEKLEEKGTLDIEVICSGQKIPVQIHYIEENGRTTGVGLFTNEGHPDIYIYDYMFFKVTDMFPRFASQSSLILLADSDKNRFYSDEKVYSEIFYLYSSGKTEYFLSENQRIVGLDAKLRTDFKMFTDDILEQDFKNILFFSSRYYTAYAADNKADILISGGEDKEKDNIQYIEDIASLNFWRSEKGTYYFANTENGFDLRLFDGDETTYVVKSFDGNLKEDYIIKASFLLNKKSGEIFSITENKSYKINYSDFGMNFNPDLFSVSENGRYFMLRGANNLKKPALGIFDTETEAFYTYKDDIFGFIASMHITDDGTAVISVATGESAASYYQLIGIAGGNTAENTEPVSHG